MILEPEFFDKLIDKTYLPATIPHKWLNLNWRAFGKFLESPGFELLWT